MPFEKIILSRCRGVEVSRCRGVEVSRCRGVEVSRCRGVEVFSYLIGVFVDDLIKSKIQNNPQFSKYIFLIFSKKFIFQITF